MIVPLIDGHYVSCNIFRPNRPGQFPPIIAFTPYGKDSDVAVDFKRYWDFVLRDHPDVVQGESSGKYLTWEVPDPGALDAGRLRDRGGRCARHRQVARLLRADVGAADARRLRRDRMGRRAAVVERQGRHARRLVSGDQAVAGGGAAAAASRRDDPVGGHVRPLSRLLPPRRHLLVVLHEAVVGLADRREPERQRRHAVSRPLHRRALDRRGARSAGAAGQYVQPVRDRAAASVRRCVFHGRGRRGRSGSRCRSSPPATGAASACICAAT